MKYNIAVSPHKYYKGLKFAVKRMGEKRVSLEIVHPKPDNEGFVSKYFKKGPTESIHFFYKRCMNRDYFNKNFKIIS